MENKNLVYFLKLANSIGNMQFGTDKDVLFVDAFFFYLQGKTLYFTETDKDSVVIAVIHIEKLRDSS